MKNDERNSTMNTCRADANGLYIWIRGEKVVLTGIRTFTNGLTMKGFGIPLACTCFKGKEKNSFIKVGNLNGM